MISEHRGLLSVADAAARLGVVPSRVRALAQGGQLEGYKIGRRWFFSPAHLDRWARRHRIAGRPLSPPAALGLLFEVSGEPAVWLDRVRRWKVVHAQAASDLPTLVARTARRAERIERRAHPSDVPRIAAEPGVVRSGVSAVADHGIGLVAPGVVELYVDRPRAADLLRRYALIPSDEPNVILHVVDLPAALRDRDVMPLGVVIVDLLDSGEPRAEAAARRAWHRLGRR
jgi:excisionase family DNA binding protein